MTKSFTESTFRGSKYTMLKSVSIKNVITSKQCLRVLFWDYVNFRGNGWLDNIDFEHLFILIKVNTPVAEYELQKLYFRGIIFAFTWKA